MKKDMWYIVQYTANIELAGKGDELTFPSYPSKLSINRSDIQCLAQSLYKACWYNVKV